MKNLMLVCAAMVYFSTTSCYGQKLVQQTTDAKKLEISKEKFLGKPLSLLLKQIRPKIFLVYGNPENTSTDAYGGTTMVFHFINKEEFNKKYLKNEKPLSITIFFEVEPKNNRKALPKGGLLSWTERETKEYGDMIIRKIRVSGDVD